MSRRLDAIGNEYGVCRWINLREALHQFGTYSGATQSQQHIKPLQDRKSTRLNSSHVD